MPQNPNRKSLGLGLGLQPGQRAGFRQAVQGGTLTDFLGQHPRAQKRFGRDLMGQGPLGGTGAQAGRQQQLGQAFGGKNAASAGGNTGPPGGGGGDKMGGAGGSPGAAAGPPGGAGQKGQMGSAPPAVNAAAAGGAAPSPGGAGAPSGGAPKTLQDFLNSTFGSGNPFGTRANFSDPSNPVFAGAKRALDQQLAATRARFGASGTGQSDREALLEGNALGDFGAQVAQLGEQAYQSDAQRALQAALGGQQNLMNLNQGLAGLGTGLTGLGAQEQQLGGMSGILQLLSQLSGGTSTGNVSGKTSAYG